MASTPQQEFKGPYIGRSPGDGGSFADAARNAEQDLYDKHGEYPHPDVTFRADCYVTIGNPIHEFIVQLVPNP
jgi:hypothetical protein